MSRHQVPPLTAVEREDHRLRAIEARKQRARMLGGVRDGRVDPRGVLMRRDRVDVDGDACEKPRDIVERIRKLAAKEQANE